MPCAFPVLLEENMYNFYRFKLSLLVRWLAVKGLLFKLRIHFEYVVIPKMRYFKRRLFWQLFDIRRAVRRTYHLSWRLYYFVKQNVITATQISLAIAVLGAPAFAPVLKASPLGALAIVGAFFAIGFLWSCFMYLVLDALDCLERTQYKLGTQDCDYHSEEFSFKEYISWSHT